MCYINTGHVIFPSHAFRDRVHVDNGSVVNPKSLTNGNCGLWRACQLNTTNSLHPQIFHHLLISKQAPPPPLPFTFLPSPISSSNPSFWSRITSYLYISTSFTHSSRSFTRHLSHVSRQIPGPCHLGYIHHGLSVST